MRHRTYRDHKQKEKHCTQKTHFQPITLSANRNSPNKTNKHLADKHGPTNLLKDARCREKRKIYTAEHKR